MTIVTVLFDLDNTLHDRTGSLRAFVADQHQRWFSDKVAREHFVERFVLLNANGHLPKNELYPRLLGELDISEVDTHVLVAEYGARYHAFARPKEGALDMLRALRQRRIKLGIVSNGWTDFQLRTVEASGFSDIVDAVLISQAEDLRKPDPRLSERAAARLGVARQRCLFVGDNPLADIDGARRSRMRTAWIPGGFSWPDDLARADWQIDSLSELLSFV